MLRLDRSQSTRLTDPLHDQGCSELVVPYRDMRGPIHREHLLAPLEQSLQGDVVVSRALGGRSRAEGILIRAR
jgi:hypothetical protein